MKYDIKTDGCTQGLLAQWLQCRQKARWFMTGYSVTSASMALTYGSIGHAVLELVYKDLHTKVLKESPSEAQVRNYVAKVETEWRKENVKADKKALEYLELSLMIAESTLPSYFKYWTKDLKEMKWHAVEHDFAVPYTTKDGRKTIIRGKMDGVFNNPKLWLFENKFKSQIDEADLVEVLPFEFQVQMYLWALRQKTGKVPEGVLYNIIRRTCLRQKVDEGITQFAKRISEDIKARPEFYFLRLEVSISEKELDQFSIELEDMITDFMNWWEGKSGHYKNTHMCLDKFGRCNYLPLCSSKNFALYEKRDKMYRELDDY